MLQELVDFETRVPAWLRPAYRGALFIPAMASGRGGKLFVAALLAMLLWLLGAPEGLLFFGKLVLVAVAAGGVAGILHGLLRPLQRWWPLGSWLYWSMVLMGFGLAVVGLAPAGPFTLAEPTFYPLAAGLAALAGLVIVLLDDRSLARPSTRKFQRVRARERLWASARELRARKLMGAPR